VIFLVSRIRNYLSGFIPIEPLVAASSCCSQRRFLTINTLLAFTQEYAEKMKKLLKSLIIKELQKIVGKLI
jgi:hypothetical protein